MTACLTKCKTNIPENRPRDIRKNLRAIAYNLKKVSPNYELIFKHTCNYYEKPLVSLANSPDKFIV